MSAVTIGRLEFGDGEEASGAAATLAERAAEGLEVLAGGDENVGFAWLIAPDLDAEGLRALCVEAGVEAPLTVGVGTLIAETGSAEGATMAIPMSFAVPAEELDGFDHWYVEEHEEMLLATAGWLRIRRFALETGPWNRLVIHDLTDGDALADPQVAAAMDSPTRRRLAESAWFTESSRVPLRRC
jgi:hypothetical protein